MKDCKLLNLAMALSMLALLPSLALGQIIWSDDFESNTVGGSAQGWTSYDGGTPNGNWTIVTDGSKTLDQSVPNCYDTWCVADNCPDVSTLCMRAKVKITAMDGAGTACFLVRMNGGDFHIGYGDDGAGTQGIYIYDDFEGEMLGIVDQPLEHNTWYYYQACLCEGTLMFKVWDAADPEPYEYALTATTTHTTAGGIGLRTSGAAARFDDVEIFGSCSTIPTMSEWGLILLIALLAISAVVIVRRKLSNLTA